MSISLDYKGKDISDSVVVSDYTYDSYSEFHADTLELIFADADDLWDRWNPEIGDEIRLKDDNLDTGIMFIKEFIPTPSYFSIKASSVPFEEANSRSDAWEGITLFQLGKDIASRYGLSFRTYKAKDYKFAYIEQDQKEDLKLYSDICAIAGHAFLIFNKSLILYEIKAMQSEEASANISLSGENEFKLMTKPEITGCKVSNGSFEYEYKTSNKSIKNIVLNIAMKSKSEAMAYAENLCYWFNRDCKCGYFYANPIASEYAAGSVINIEIENAPSFNGKAMISHIRHSYSKGNSKIWFREVK